MKLDEAIARLRAAKTVGEISLAIDGLRVILDEFDTCK